jgi:predicted nucleic acid-binding protein
MSGFLFDTNIPSETAKLRPEPRVTAWIKQQPNDTLYLSVVSIGELRRGFIPGVIPLPQGPRRTRLEQWLENDVTLWFDRRILPVTKEIADRWGVIDGTCQMRGMPANTADGMIAGTALEHGLTVVTRNVRDFAGSAFSFLIRGTFHSPPRFSAARSATRNFPAASLPLCGYAAERLSCRSAASDNVKDSIGNDPAVNPEG